VSRPCVCCTLCRVTLLLCVLLLLPSANQSLLAVQPAGTQTLNLDTGRIDRLFSRYDQAGSPGCALAITHEGELVYSAGYGEANLDYGIEIRPDTRFEAASLAKQFVAASLLLLDQEGKIDLDEDVRSYVPELPDFGFTITPRHLIHHTSGLRDIIHLLQIHGRGLDRETTRDELVDLVLRQRGLNFRPGTSYLYGNAGYVVAALLIERVTGQSLDEFAQEHLFEPSGMENTLFHDDPGTVIPNRARSYRPWRNEFGEFSRDHVAWVGPRGLVTTVEDLAAWDRNFVDNRTALEDFGERMTERGRMATGITVNYAAGLVLRRYNGLRTISHDGNYMGFRSYYLRFHERETAVVLLCNLSTAAPSILAYRVADILFEEEFEEREQRQEQEEEEEEERRRRELEERLPGYAGTYENTTLDARYELVPEDQELYLEREHPPTGALTYEGDGRFTLEDWTITLDWEEERAVRMTIAAPASGEVKFKRVTADEE